MRPRKFPPSVLHHKASGQAFIRWQGRTHYLGKFNSPEAAEAYRRLLGELSTGGPPPKAAASDHTVANVLAEWWTREAPRYGVSRELPHFRRATAIVAEQFGSLPAADFTARKLAAVQLAMAKSWCRNVVNRQVTRIRTVWRWAETEGLVPPGSWGNLRTLHPLAPNDARVRHTLPVRAATDADYAAVLCHLGRTGKAMLRVQWLTGMRSSEVRTMTWEEIDRRGAEWIYRPAKHKNAWRGHTRVIVLGPRARAVLRWHCPKPPAVGPVFVTRRGAAFGPTGYQQLVRRAAQAAGVPGFHAYQLRHAAKDRITREHGLDAARSVLGQKSIDSTNGYGTAVDAAAAARVMRKSG